MHTFHRLPRFKEERPWWRDEIHAGLGCPTHSLKPEPHGAKRATRTDDCEVNLCKKQFFILDEYSTRQDLILSVSNPIYQDYVEVTCKFIKVYKFYVKMISGTH